MRQDLGHLAHFGKYAGCGSASPQNTLCAPLLFFTGRKNHIVIYPGTSFMPIIYTKSKSLRTKLLM